MRARSTLKYSHLAADKNEVPRGNMTWQQSYDESLAEILSQVHSFLGYFRSKGFSMKRNII